MCAELKKIKINIKWHDIVYATNQTVTSFNFQISKTPMKGGSMGITQVETLKSKQWKYLPMK